VPSAVSQQISRLERDLGGPLFDRTSRTVCLTPAGHVLFREATGVLTALDRADAETRLAIREMTKSLRVGYVSSGHGSLVLATAIAYEAANPELRIDLHEMSSPAVVSAVSAGELDAGFAWEAEAPPSLRTINVAHRSLVVLVSDTHHLAAHTGLSSSDLKDEEIVLERRENNPGLHDQILTALSVGGELPSVQRQVGGVATMAKMVRTNRAVGIVVDDGLEAELDRGAVAVPLDCPLDCPQVSLDLFWCATTQSRIVMKFINHMTSELSGRRVALRH
jgi:DNA-binding transcriptional LysR family regulator